MNAVYVHVYVSFATWLFNDMYMTIPILCFFIHHNSISSFLILGFSTCPLLSFFMPRLLSFMRSCSPVDTHTLVISMCLWMRLMRNQHLMPPCLFWGTSLWKLIVLNTFNQFSNQRSLLTSVFVERGGDGEVNIGVMIAVDADLCGFYECFGIIEFSTCILIE